MKAFALSLALAAFLAAPALAQQEAPAQPQKPPCGPRAAIPEGLAKKYKEFPTARGLTSEGLMIEVFASESGSFTVLMNRPDGIACILSGGEVWETQEIPKGKPA